MRTQVNTSFGMVLRNGLAAMFWIAFSSVTSAQLASTTYYTAPGATVEESGTYVANGSRVVPLTTTLTFDLTATTPSLTALIHDAVLEGGHPYADGWLGGRQQPFELSVRSLSGMQLADGSYRFTGDYLQDIYPSGTQYVFDWRFSIDSEQRVLWNGYTYWAGGHLWQIDINDVMLVPEPSCAALLLGGGILLAVDLRRRLRRRE